jgi:DNA-binding transcriptional MerR regulator
MDNNAENTSTLLQIGELARKAKVSIRTVRFYEEKDLLKPSSTTSGGIRLYTNRDVNRLIFIRRLKILGLSIDEIKLCLGDLSQEDIRQVRAEHTLELLNMQKQKLEEQMSRLEEMKAEINTTLEKVKKCKTCGAPRCPENCANYGQLL